jgi:beta-lactam-binding protein with PASTA domain
LITACSTAEGTPQGNATSTTSPSASPAAILVPSLTGQRIASAVATLEDLGLRVRVREKFSKERPDRVLSLAPAAGTEVDARSKIVLTVSIAFPEVPGVLGSSLARATKKLKAAGYKVRHAVGRTVQGSETLSTVIAVSPPPGTPLLPGKTITVTTPSAPPVAPPPTSSDSGSGSTTPAAAPPIQCCPEIPTDPASG